MANEQTFKTLLTFHESSWLFNDGILISWLMKQSPYIYIPGTQMTSIFEGQPPKARPNFQSKQGAPFGFQVFIWVVFHPLYTAIHEGQLVTETFKKGDPRDPDPTETPRRGIMASWDGNFEARFFSMAEQ